MSESQEKYLERYKKILLEIISEELPGCKVYLFGSRACGDYYSGSDIDLALDAGKPIDTTVIGKLLGDIEETTIPLKVDLVDLHSISGKFKEQVEKEMILWKN